MMQRNLFFSLVLFCAAALPAAAAGAGRYAITAGQIAAAVTGHGIQVSPDQVTFLSSVMAHVESPDLKVKSIDPMGGQRAIARLECSDSRQCLPFVVSLHFEQTANAQPAPPDIPRPAPVIAQATHSAIVLRAGSPAVLLLNGAHVHISLPVICLDSGAPGQTIRVTDRDRRLVYTGKVTENGILEGRL
jgi:hypothetical protein